MIETNYRTDTFEDAVQATTYIARVDVSHGELRLPPRVREHLADGDVVVHLVRGGDDVAVHTAQLTATSKLVGVAWPEDIVAGTRVTVLCPRGGASHDIGVLLPDLPEEPRHLIECEPIADDDVDAMLAELPDEDTDSDAPAPVTDEQLAAITGALTALADATPVAESTLPGPADYTVPTAPARTDEPTEQLDAVEPTEPKWPGEEDSEERTDLLPVVVAPVRSPEPPRRKPGWLERRVRLAARWVLDRSWTATRILVATASGLILAGAGLGYAVLAVFQ